MRALSVRPPWSAAIAHFGKTVENRTWYTRHRGPLAIHASAMLDGGRERSDHIFERVADLSGLPDAVIREAAQVRSAIVAVARLTTVCSASLPVEAGFPLRCPCGPWAVAGQRHFRLADVRPLVEPVPARGALGLWDLPDEVEAAVLAQLRTGAAR
ncbi:hypothetical protein ACRYCC_26075 [Actinomadura scrupuli]|uniref:hypothetical protein n=1 Tax=Actinomadura scrupuli TaxID=559629 RepID=UPI003D995D82